MIRAREIHQKIDCDTSHTIRDRQEGKDSVMPATEIKRGVVGLFTGVFSTVFIREVLESTLGWAGLSTAAYAFTIGIVALLVVGTVQNWKYYQMAIASGAAVLGAVAGIVVLLSLVSA